MKNYKGAKKIESDVESLKNSTLAILDTTPDICTPRKKNAKDGTPGSIVRNFKATKNSVKRKRAKLVKLQKLKDLDSTEVNDGKRQKLDEEAEKPDQQNVNTKFSESKKKIGDTTKVMKFIEGLKTTKSDRTDLDKNAPFSCLSDLGVSDLTLKAIKEIGFEYMMEVQAQVIPHLLQGVDLLVTAKTGSGRTLAFLIPAIEKLCKTNFKSQDGTGVLVICPNRELAMQTYGVLQMVLQYHTFTFGLLIGGIKKATEVKKLESGVNIVVATPGKLLDHLLNSKQFLISNLRCLVIDEADIVLGGQFEDQIKQIMKLLPEQRQTMLFSGTQTSEKDFAKVSGKKMPMYIGIDDSKAVVTNDGLKQNFVICSPEKRFSFLANFLRRHHSNKIMVFVSSCNSVRYHKDLLHAVDIPVFYTCSEQHQRKRMETFFKFYHAKSGILLCTDVAARGWDVPHIDWIVQYDPPIDPKEYIQRVGGTARGVGGTGCALLILQPHEHSFVDFLQANRVPIEEINFPWMKNMDVESDLTVIKEQCNLQKRRAKQAFKAYFRAYCNYELKTAFEVRKVEIEKIASAFGFDQPPSLPKKVQDLTNPCHSQIAPVKECMDN